MLAKSTVSWKFLCVCNKVNDYCTILYMLQIVSQIMRSASMIDDKCTTTFPFFPHLQVKFKRQVVFHHPEKKGLITKNSSEWSEVDGTAPNFVEQTNRQVWWIRWIQNIDTFLRYHILSYNFLSSRVHF